jgi:hypothetical protein
MLVVNATSYRLSAYFEVDMFFSLISEAWRWSQAVSTGKSRTPTTRCYPLGKLTVWPWKWPIYSGNKQIPTPTARVELLIYWRVNSEINVVLQWNQRLLSFSPRVWTFPVPLNSLQGLVQWMPQYLKGYRWDVGKVRWSMQLIPGFVCRTNHFTTT